MCAASTSPCSETHLEASLSAFQGKVAQTACMSACKHLSTSLMQQLLEAEVRQLSLGALQQFSLDVAECERKAAARSGSGAGYGKEEKVVGPQSIITG